MRYLPVFWLLTAAALAWAQPPKFDTVLYGASYYHEYMPAERLDQDIALMKKAGITVVRLGESTWTSFEPRDGQFEFAWMDRILDALHGAGIRVIFGTPTYSIPPWLNRKHPDILAVRLGGQRAAYGLRQNMDITHPDYRRYCERIIRQLLGHYRNHPAIMGWQVDNETASYGTAGPNVQRAFLDHLRRKFGTVDAMNKAWGFVYWGQLVGNWDEMPAPDGMVNPGYKLEWQRYQAQIVTDFLSWQAKLVNEYKRPDQFVTHNFVGGVLTAIDQRAIARTLDVAAVNPYHPVQDELDGWWSTLSGDLCRSLKGQQNYLITETNAQATGWDSKGQFPPYDGQLRLSAYSHLARGANAVLYWHWHSLHYGQETFWKGLLGHDLEPNRVYNEALRIGNEWKRAGPRLVNFRPRSEVAILFSVDSHHGLKFMPFDDKADYLTVLQQMHKALYRLNVSADFVFPDSENLADYKVLLVPPLYVADDALLRRLAEYVRNGGRLVMSFKSGFTDEFGTVRATRMPGPLREAAGFSYQEFSTLKKPLALKGDPFAAGVKGNEVSLWAEFLLPETAQPLAFYDHPFLGKFPAITRNNYGSGTFTYQGTHLSAALQEKLLADVLRTAKLTGPDQLLPKAVRVEHGAANSGRAMHFYLNYSAQPQTFTYSYGPATEILSGKAYARAASITLPAWDLAIFEERESPR